jgi:hypothetical protein
MLCYQEFYSVVPVGSHLFQALVGLSTLKDPGHTAVNPAVQTNCLTLQFDPTRKENTLQS